MTAWNPWNPTDAQEAFVTTIAWMEGDIDPGEEPDPRKYDGTVWDVAREAVDAVYQIVSADEEAGAPAQAGTAHRAVVANPSDFGDCLAYTLTGANAGFSERAGRDQAFHGLDDYLNKAVERAGYSGYADVILDGARLDMTASRAPGGGRR